MTVRSIHVRMEECVWMRSTDTHVSVCPGGPATYATRVSLKGVRQTILKQFPLNLYSYTILYEFGRIYDLLYLCVRID